MERRFDMSDFEQSLKDHADQFELIPSKRIWNGIYNNLHPGSKWPSITVAIVLLITLITVGNLNNSPKQNENNSATGSNATIEKNMPAIRIKKGIANNPLSEKNKAGIISNENYLKDKSDNIPDNSTTTNSSSINIGNTMIDESNKVSGNSTSKEYTTTAVKNISNLAGNTQNSNSKNQKTVSNNSSINSINNNPGDSHENLIVINDNNTDGNILPSQKSTSFNDADEVYKLQNNIDDAILKEAFNSIQNDLILNVSNQIATYKSDEFPTPISEENESAQSKNTSSINSKNENQQHNAAAHVHRKKNRNIEWSYYVTPLISKATYRGKGIEPPTTSIFSPIVILQDPSANGMIYNAKMGFETGAKMTYTISKKWKFLTGFNLNYSDYNIVSNLLHPTFATLMLKDTYSGMPYSKSYITYYGNGQSLNQVSLNNYNLQASIPIGLQYSLWKNKKLEISIASAIEPSIVLKSYAYIISADKRYYVNDPTLMRKMNLGGNFGSFITFSSRKVKWHIGPDVHYQLLSTYKGYYPIKEHLIDYGIRIGISR